jgi:hypothetical protein
MTIESTEVEIIAIDPNNVDESILLDESDFSELDDPSPLTQSISYLGTDFDVEGLIRRLKRNDIVVPSFGHSDPTVEAAGFQRAFVWRRAQMDKFIESLLLGFPVPGIVLVQQEDKRYLVLDGQQRLTTLARFYAGTHDNKVFSLRNVAPDFQGLTYAKLSEEQRRTLDNTFIQAIIVKTDSTTASLESVYQVFERLNSGGTQLTGHEIRVALYAGELIDFVAKINQTKAWRAVYGPVSPRLRDQELIFRIIALFVAPGTYKRPMKKFLNDFAGNHRNCTSLQTESLTDLIGKACNILNDAAGPKAFRYLSKQVNIALTEAVMVGLMRRLEVGGVAPTSEAINRALDELVHDGKFVEAITRATADEEEVKYRLALATKVLGAA